jgi:chromosome segregation ATPase
VIKDTRSNQGRPFTDHRNALTFKEQLKHTQKEHATLTNKYEHLIGSHNSAITALRSHEMEAERRKAHAEEEKVISDRIQKNLDALQEKPTNPRARSASTQTQHSETLKADDQVKYLQEKLDEKTHQNELLISKQKHWTGTITSLRKRLEVRRKINENFRTHSANQLGNIGWLSNQRTTLHDRIKQLEREMLRPAGHSSRGEHGKANANELAHKLKKAKAKITCLSDDIRKKDKQIEDHQRWTNGMPVIFEPIPENTNTLEQKDLHIQKLTFQLAERDNQYTALLSITERDKAAGSARRVN